MLDFDISNELKDLIRKLSKKDIVRVTALNKKIREIVSNDIAFIDRYKNCRYDLKDYKGVHIDRSFVLLFKVYKERKFIYFWRLEHHDDAYAR
jgi:YafQ family addiction module toxin component